MSSESGAFWPWWLGGLVIGVIAAAHPLLLGRPLGVSGLYKRLVELLRERFDERRAPAATVASEKELAAALDALTAEEFGLEALEASEPEPAEPPAALRSVVAQMDDRWSGRPLFLLGILLGGALTRVGRGWASPTSLGHAFDARFHGVGAPGTAAVLALAGVAIGFGTRLSGGCTSGHGISGVACGQRGSLLATATFWTTGVAVAWLLTTSMGR